MAATTGALTTELPVGVSVRDLQMHRDDRGIFTEIFREEWDTGVAPVQWNCVSWVAGTLRGVHVHFRHDDYLLVVKGLASIALRDLRRDSPTWGLTAVVDLDGDRQRALTIPTGVAHGFYFRRDSMHIYSVSHYWDTGDEMGCRWDDTELELPWRIPEDPRLSSKDASAGTLKDMIAEYERRRAQGDVRYADVPDGSDGEIRLP